MGIMAREGLGRFVSDTVWLCVQMVTVVVHWEMYDGIPLMAKWVSVSGLPEVRDKLKMFVVSVEYLAVNWQWAPSGYGWLHVENDVPHTVVQWTVDSVGVLPGALQVEFHRLFICSVAVALCGSVV